MTGPRLTLTCGFKFWAGTGFSNGPQATEEINGKNPHRGERPPAKCCARRGVRTRGFFSDRHKHLAIVSRASAGVPFAGRVHQHEMRSTTRDSRTPRRGIAVQRYNYTSLYDPHITGSLPTPGRGGTGPKVVTKRVECNLIRTHVPPSKGGATTCTNRVAGGRSR